MIHHHQVVLILIQVKYKLHSSNSVIKICKFQIRNYYPTFAKIFARRIFFFTNKGLKEKKQQLFVSSKYYLPTISQADLNFVGKRKIKHNIISVTKINL